MGGQTMHFSHNDGMGSIHHTDGRMYANADELAWLMQFMDNSWIDDLDDFEQGYLAGSMIGSGSAGEAFRILVNARQMHAEMGSIRDMIQEDAMQFARNGANGLNFWDGLNVGLRGDSDLLGITVTNSPTVWSQRFLDDIGHPFGDPSTGEISQSDLDWLIRGIGSGATATNRPLNYDEMNRVQLATEILRRHNNFLQGEAGPHIYLNRWVADVDQRANQLDPYSNMQQAARGEESRTRFSFGPNPHYAYLSEDLLRAILYVSDWAYREDEGGHGTIVINAIAGLNHSGTRHSDEHARGFAVDFSIQSNPWSPNVSNIQNVINVDNRIEIRDYLEDMNFITQHNREEHWGFLTQQTPNLQRGEAGQHYIGDFRNIRSFHLSIWGRLPQTSTPTTQPSSNSPIFNLDDPRFLEPLAQ